MCASSATGMSLVPAQTTAILPLPCTVRSRQKRIAPEAGKCSASGSACLTMLAVCSDARVMRTLGETSSSRAAMATTCSGCLVEREDNFGHAVPKRAVMIDLGKPEIFERQVAQALERGINVHRAVFHFMQQAANLVGCHRLNWRADPTRTLWRCASPPFNSQHVLRRSVATEAGTIVRTRTCRGVRVRFRPPCDFRRAR